MTRGRLGQNTPFYRMSHASPDIRVCYGPRAAIAAGLRPDSAKRRARTTADGKAPPSEPEPLGICNNQTPDNSLAAMAAARLLVCVLCLPVAVEPALLWEWEPYRPLLKDFIYKSDDEHTAWVRVPLEVGGAITVACNLATVVSCRLPPGPGVTSLASGHPAYGLATRTSSGTCTCTAPPVDAASTAGLEFSADNKTFTKANVSVAFFAIWSPSQWKRPYVSTDQTAQIVMQTDAAAGDSLRLTVQHANGSELQLLGSGVDGVIIPAGKIVAVAFSLKQLPSLFDGWLTVTLKDVSSSIANGHSVLQRKLRLMRVTAPPTTLASFSYLDYSRRSVMVNDSPYNPVGFYSAWGGTLGALFDDLTGQSELGVNVVMQYQTNGCLVPTKGSCANHTQLLLDHCAPIGIKVMLDVAPAFRTIVCGDFNPKSKACPAMQLTRRPVSANQRRDSPNVTAAWIEVETAVRAYQNHEALLGWYVCDDCMTSWISAQRAAGTPTVNKMYNRLKKLDPYHVAIGAVESVNMFVFTSSNVFVPEASLDLPMFENYQGFVSENAARGSNFQEPGNDGSVREYPNTFQPIVNCPGPYAYDGRDAGRRSGITQAHRAVVTYSMSWVSAVVADTPAQLYFRRVYAGNSSSELMSNVGLYTTLTTKFAAFLTAPPPLVISEAQPPTGYQPRAVTSVPEATTRAAVWVLPNSSNFCTLLVVVNLVPPPRNATAAPTGCPINVSIAPDFARQWPASTSASAQVVDGGATFKRGLFMDGTFSGLTIGAEGSAVFVLGDCPGSTRFKSDDNAGDTPAYPNARPLLHVTSPGNHFGDAVGLLWNAAMNRYDVSWDSQTECGWGHASTTNFLSYRQHGCSGPSRIGGPVMSGSIAVKADGTPLAVVGWKGDVYLSSADNASMHWFVPAPNVTTPIIGPCNCKYKPHPRGCSENFAPDVNCTFLVSLITLCLFCRRLVCV